MEINSPGGLIPQSLELIRIMDKLSCTVRTLCCGVVNGTAVAIAAHGARGFRGALPTCRFSLALDAAATDSTPAPGKEEPLAQMVVDLLVRDGAKDRAQIVSWVESGAVFGAQEALEAGLIDFIAPPPGKAAIPPAAPSL